MEATDRLSADAIGTFLKKYQDYTTTIRAGMHEVIVLPEIDSTNEEVKRRRTSGARDGLVVLSERQSAGKGRRGRHFYSPDGSGIYMSMLLEPRDIDMEDGILVTTQAAVAVAHAVSEICGKEPEIKWVNDIFLGEKKICGILTEAVSSPDGGVDSIVVGIGINVFCPSEIPSELEGIMGYIFEKNESAPVSRNEIAAVVIRELRSYFERLPERVFLEEYRRRSNVIGKRVMFGTPGEVAGQAGEDWREGLALAIDDSGGLVVRLPDGTEEILHSGEISLRVDETETADVKK